MPLTSQVLTKPYLATMINNVKNLSMGSPIPAGAWHCRFLSFPGWRSLNMLYDTQLNILNISHAAQPYVQLYYIPCRRPGKYVN